MQDNAWGSFIKGAAAVGGFILGLYGVWDVFLSALVCCMTVDFILGLLVARLGKSPKTEHGKLSSSACFHGLVKKGVIMLMVLLATQLDRVIGDANAFRSMACLFYIANEGLSALENSALAGVPWPDGLKCTLEQMKTDKEE